MLISIHETHTLYKVKVDTHYIICISDIFFWLTLIFFFFHKLLTNRGGWVVYIAKMAKFEKPLENCVQFFWFAIDRFFPLIRIFIVFSTAHALFFAQLLGSTMQHTSGTISHTSSHIVYIYISMPITKPILSPILHTNTKSLLNDCLT